MRIRENSSYHRWLWVSLLVVSAMVLAACSPSDGGDTATTAAAGGGDTATTEAADDAPATTAAPVEAITLEIQASQPEFKNAEEQLWDIFEAQNPGVTVETFAVNEDQVEAYRARRAGGYAPAFEAGAMGPITAENAANWIDLLTVDTQWLDRWTYDVTTAESERVGTTGLHSVDTRAGRFITWMYNADLMEDLGLDPRTVKTQADLIQLLKDGTELVNARDDIDYFWDQAWHNWMFGVNYMGNIPLMASDGRRIPEQQASWAGEITDPAQDPYRYTFQWWKDRYDEGVLNEEFWLREWETDMEASYLAGKSVMMLHGPWPWDKMLAENPDARQLGIPATPPLVEGDPWVQYVSAPIVDNGWRIPIENADSPNFELILKAFNFWNSPDIVEARAQINGQAVVYTLDQPLVLESPQFLGIVQELQPGGFYEDVILEIDVPGADAIAEFKNEDTGVYWDWQWNDRYRELMNDEITVDEMITWFHEQVANDYTLP